jgi:hypothetical protein
VFFYRDFYSSLTPNYDYLFATFDTSVAPGTEPPANSLFNMQNMRMLVQLGKSTPNICTDNTLIYDSNFTLPSMWNNMTYYLGLDYVEQTYMLWLWLDTAYNITFNRMDIGGNNQFGNVGVLASKTLKNTIATMQIELPMFILASQFNMTYWQGVQSSNWNCTNFYETQLSFPSTQAIALCTNDTSNTFNFLNDTNNFQGYIKTCVALTSIYLYGNMFNTASANYANLFSAITGWSSVQIKQQIHNPLSATTNFFNTQLNPPVYAHYSSAAVDGGICNSSILT